MRLLYTLLLVAFFSIGLYAQFGDEKWEDGKFDKGQLDGAISSIQHVLDENKLGAEDREALSGDISQLRKMREAHDRHEIERKN
jgi:hypothetical protein